MHYRKLITILCSTIAISLFIWSLTSSVYAKRKPQMLNHDANKTIESFEFDEIVIEGKMYSYSDIILLPDRVKKYGGLKEDHSLSIEEIDEIIGEHTKTIIIGTGADGLVNVPQESLKYLKKKGITPHVLQTPKAVELYNQSPKENLIAVLHITC